MKLFVLTALAASVLATSGYAGSTNQATVAAANYVHRDMIWDQDAQSTRPTLIVDVDGKITRYEVGDLGLTETIVMSDNPAVHADWAREVTGRDLTVIVPGGEPLK